MEPEFELSGGPFTGCRIRFSARARYVRLQISPREGLVVVAPHDLDPGLIPAMLERKRPWIENQLRRFAQGKFDLHKTPPEALKGFARDRDDPELALPEVIDLPVLGELWRISCKPANSSFVGVLSEPPGMLILYGAVQDRSACRRVLINWLKLRAREELCSWLQTLAAENGFKFRESSVRGQKTRWASCSSRGTISLSYKLLFLERDWVRCVLLHELCHTVFMDHSANFRILLQRVEPECRRIDREMRDAWKLVPAWTENCR